MNEFDKHLTIILKEMCDVIDVDMNSVNFDEDKWYSKHSWTEEQEKKFNKWLYKYLRDNLEARKELMNFPSKTKKNLNQMVALINLMWGWKTKE